MYVFIVYIYHIYTSCWELLWNVRRRFTSVGIEFSRFGEVSSNQENLWGAGRSNRWATVRTVEVCHGPFERLWEGSNGRLYLSFYACISFHRLLTLME